MIERVVNGIERVVNGDETPRFGLRERKKAQTRIAIAETAKSMFGRRGYDQVTVAEIADAANVSVKTLFSYFASKEDLIFVKEDGQCEEILRWVGGRAPGKSAFDAMRDMLETMLDDPEAAPGLEEHDRLARHIGTSLALQSRARLMWDRFEDALTEMLANELRESNGRKRDPSARIVATQLVAMYRSLASNEARDFAGGSSAKQRREGLGAWLEASADAVGNGVARYGISPRTEARNVGKSRKLRREIADFSRRRGACSCSLRRRA